MVAQTDLFRPPRTSYLVYPSRESDRRDMRERYGTDRLYDGDHEEYARVQLSFATRSIRIPAVMVERLPSGRVGRMVVAQPAGRRR